MAAVYAFVRWHVERWRMTLPRHQWEKVAADAHRILSADLMDRTTQEGLHTFQAQRGRLSGASRRAATSGRDAEVLAFVQDGGTISSASRAFGLARSTVRNILRRGLAHLCSGDEPNIQVHTCAGGDEPNI